MFQGRLACRIRQITKTLIFEVLQYLHYNIRTKQILRRNLGRSTFWSRNILIGQGFLLKLVYRLPQCFWSKMNLDSQTIGILDVFQIPYFMLKKRTGWFLETSKSWAPAGPQPVCLLIIQANRPCGPPACAPAKFLGNSRHTVWGPTQWYCSHKIAYTQAVGSQEWATVWATTL